MRAAVYKGWISRTEPDAERLSLKREVLGAFAYLPRISVLMVVSDPDEIWIQRSISSVLGQVYPHFEVCVCDNASGRSHVMESLEEFAASDQRVKVHHLEESVSRAEAGNQALSLATGEFVLLLDAGDVLSPDALFSVVELLQNVEADVVYADEDSVDIADRRSDPVFKPYWSPDLLLSTMYVGRPCAVRRDLVEKVGRFREGFEGAEEYDLLLRVSEKTGLIQHLPRLLYHRRTCGEERESAGDDVQTRRRAGRVALRRRSGEHTVKPDFAPGSARPVRGLSGQPTVSVVALVLDEKVAGNARDVAKDSSYPVHEVLVTGPASERRSSGGLADMVNRAAGEATGDYLLFLQNYQEAMSPDWISHLLRQAQRPEVGAVGGKVLNSGGGIRSAGNFPSLNKLTGGLPNALVQESSAPFLPVIDHPFNPCAASLDCMMVSGDLFEEVGGFHEAPPTMFYDLDLSFRLVEKGLLNVYTPDVSVVATGINRPLPDVNEIAYMWRRWWSMLARELHYMESPLDSGYEVFEGELPLFLQVQSGSWSTRQ